MNVIVGCRPKLESVQCLLLNSRGALYAPSVIRSCFFFLYIWWLELFQDVVLALKQLKLLCYAYTLSYLLLPFGPGIKTSAFRAGNWSSCLFFIEHLIRVRMSDLFLSYCRQLNLLLRSRGWKLSMLDLGYLPNRCVTETKASSFPLFVQWLMNSFSPTSHQSSIFYYYYY